MSSKNYAKGAAFEYRVKEHFEKLGYDVTRSSGSHSVKDLVAFKGTADGKIDVVLIQCKTNGRLPPDERQALKDIVAKHNFMVRAVHAYKGDGGHAEFEKI